MEFDSEGILGLLTTNHIPEITLAVGGIIAVIMTVFYLKDRKSLIYKLFMLIGLIFGIFMAVVAFNAYTAGVALSITTSVIMYIAAFTLIIRPFKEVHFAVLIALLTMGVVYVLLGGLTGTIVEFLAEGWPRIIVAVISGAIVYSLLHMLESIVKIIGKILNAWPILFIFGLVCIAEAIMVTMGYGSVYDYVRHLIENR
ncbi:MAG: hypothetical protein FWD37_03240 [Methanomassiliicoccaceae archaeon]|nr:hypothetical protein [Methanomassiliicoccaceae archaeon]